MNANCSGPPKADSYSNRSLNYLLYDSLRRQSPDNVWWESFEPTIRGILQSDLMRPRPDEAESGKGRKLEGGATFLLYAEPMQYFLAHGVTDFLEAAGKMGYETDIRLHRPSQSKTDIGYRPEEVAITLAYAKDGRTTNYLIFTRNSPKKIDAHIPRAVLKKITGVKDIMAAARQAEHNLAGRMKSGGIGPFGLGEKDTVHVDVSSYRESEGNPHLLVNFSTGLDMLSFDMRLICAVGVIKELYGKHINFEDLWSSEWVK